MILCLDLSWGHLHTFWQCKWNWRQDIVVVKHLGVVSIGDHVHDCTPKETHVFYSSLDTTTSSTICIRGFIARTQNSANLMYPPHNTAKLSESYQKSEMYLLTICGLSIWYVVSVKENGCLCYNGEVCCHRKGLSSSDPQWLALPNVKRVPLVQPPNTGLWIWMYLPYNRHTASCNRSICSLTSELLTHIYRSSMYIC